VSSCGQSPSAAGVWRATSSSKPRMLEYLVGDGDVRALFWDQEPAGDVQRDCYPGEETKSDKGQPCDRHIDVEILGNACCHPSQEAFAGKAGEMTASAGVGLVSFASMDPCSRIRRGGGIGNDPDSVLSRQHLTRDFPDGVFRHRGAIIGIADPIASSPLPPGGPVPENRAPKNRAPETPGPKVGRTGARIGPELGPADPSPRCQAGPGSRRSRQGRPEIVGGAAVGRSIGVATIDSSQGWPAGSQSATASTPR